MDDLITVLCINTSQKHSKNYMTTEKLLSNKLYLFLNESCPSLDNNLCLENHIDQLLEFTSDRGLTSNILKYILTHNQALLERFLILKHNIILMKRDYLLISFHYYNDSITKSMEYFNKIDKSMLNSDEVDTIIVSYPKLLPCIAFMFLKHSIEYPHKAKDIIYPQPTILVDDLNFKHFLKTQGNFDIIIDAENVIYSRHSGLDKLITEIIKYQNEWNKFENSKILIITRHKDYIYKLSCVFTEIKYYYVNSTQNDDLYLIHAFYNQRVKYVITNDKYGDHIDHYKLSGHLNDRLVSYHNNVLNWCFPYSDIYVI